MSVLREVEELVFQFLSRNLDKEEVSELSSYELREKVDEESQEEIRYEIWRTFLFHEIDWGYLLDRLREEKGVD